MEDEVGQYVEEGLMVRHQTSDVRVRRGIQGNRECAEGAGPGYFGVFVFFLVFVYQQDGVFLYNNRHIEYIRVLRGAHALVMRKSVQNFVCDFR